jgi:hypothetical protein
MEERQRVVVISLSGSQTAGRSPNRLDIEGVRADQVQLVARGISWPAPRQIGCGAMLPRSLSRGARFSSVWMIARSSADEGVGAG